MKNFRLTLALCASLLLTMFVNAQTISWDTAYGGQMKYFVKAKLIIPAHDTIEYRNIWGFNASFNPFAEGITWTQHRNTSSIADTVQLFDSVPMLTTGVYLTEWEFQHPGDSASQFTPVPWPVTIVPVKVKPTIDLITVSPTTNGANATFSFNTGFDNPGQLKALVSLGDTSLANPVLQNININLLDSGISSWIPTGYPAGYTASFKLIHKTSTGSDTTAKGWFKVLPANSQWVGQVDSFGATDHVITARVQVICNGTATVRWHIAYHNQSTLTYVDQQVTGNGLTMTLYQTFNSLSATTDYDVWAEILSGPVGTKLMISTTDPIYLFNVTTDSVVAGGGDTVFVHGTVTVPSNKTAFVGSKRAAGIDLNFSFALESSPMVPYTQGVYHYVYGFTGGPTDGTINRYRVYGYCAGTQIDSGSIAFGHTVIGDTTKPVITMFDTVQVTTTTVDLVFTATDNIGVTHYVLQKNGSVIATLPGTQNAYTATGLTAGIQYLFTLVAKDDANNSSVLSSILVETDQTATSATAAVITSITPGTFCVDGHGWTTFTINGSNFVTGATVNLNYYDGQPNDDTLGTIISSGQIQGRIWTSHHYDSVDVVVKNPNAPASNVIRTRVAVCTSIEEATREEGNMLNAFPNPITDIVNIEVGLKAGYNIYSLSGQLEVSGELQKGTNQLSLQQLPAGIYILKTSTGLSKKLVRMQ